MDASFCSIYLDISLGRLTALLHSCAEVRLHYHDFLHISCLLLGKFPDFPAISYQVLPVL